MIAILFMASALAQSPEYRVDLHLDTPTQMLTKGLHFDAAQGLEASKAKLKAAGTNVVVQVLWPPRKSDHRARAFALLEVVEGEVARDSDLVIAAEPAQALDGQG